MLPSVRAEAQQVSEYVGERGVCAGSDPLSKIGHLSHLAICSMKPPNEHRTHSQFALCPFLLSLDDFSHTNIIALCV
jgi:hypothetical protein